MSDRKLQNQNSSETSKMENKSSLNSSKIQAKYGLRPRTLIKRLQTEKLRQQELPKKSGRQKPRPAPLSKYRRKTANARERHRMREINNAFESLRKALPDDLEDKAQTTNTKITTLRHAVEYIQALSKVLEDENSADSFYGSTANVDDNPHFYTQSHDGCQTFIQKSCGESYTMSVSESPHRSSLSSASDLEELLSEESGLLDDNHVFSDISGLTGPDPFGLLLSQERENLMFTTEFCSLK